MDASIRPTTLVEGTERIVKALPFTEWQQQEFRHSPDL